MDWAIIHQSLIDEGFTQDVADSSRWVAGDGLNMAVIFSHTRGTDYMEVYVGGRLFLRYALLRHRVMDEGIIGSTIKSVKRIELDRRRTFTADERVATPL